MRVKFLQSDLPVYENVGYYPFSSRILTSGNSIPVVTDHLLLLGVYTSNVSVTTYNVITNINSTVIRRGVRLVLAFANLNVNLFRR